MWTIGVQILDKAIKLGRRPRLLKDCPGIGGVKSRQKPFAAILGVETTPILGRVAAFSGDTA
jgi:hypothetical protein